MKKYPACLSIINFSYFPTFQTELFCSAKFFFGDSKSFILRLEISRGTTNAVETGQAVVDLKLEVKWELFFAHYDLVLKQAQKN